MEGEVEIEMGSGNVFADIGVAEPELALAQAKVASQINKLLRSLGKKETGFDIVRVICRPSPHKPSSPSLKRCYERYIEGDAEQEAVFDEGMENAALRHLTTT